MSRYSVHFFSNECSQTHPLGVAIEMDLDVEDKASIGDVYAGRELPPEIVRLTNNATNCPVTGRVTGQRDNHQVFLVRVKCGEASMSRLRLLCIPVTVDPREAKAK